MTGGAAVSVRSGEGRGAACAGPSGLAQAGRRGEGCRTRAPASDGPSGKRRRGEGGPRCRPEVRGRKNEPEDPFPIPNCFSIFPEN
jgi:hypothetical protein